MKKMLSAVSAVLGLGATLVGEGAWAASLTNLALSGTATQSTTRQGAEACRAIDGNTDGDWTHGSVTHTEVGDVAPWWQVDLGGTHALSRIVLWNRTDCCSERLSNFRVSVLDESQVEVFGQTYFPDGQGSFSESYPIDLPNDTKGRHVRVTVRPNSSDLRVLALAEVEVLAPGANKNGDVNGSGAVDISDAVYLLSSLFLGGPEPVPFAALPQAPKRFRDNCDGTVTDANTGLVWQKETDPGKYDWQEAVNYCNNLQLGGHDDWRLPELHELFSIIDRTHSPTIDPIFRALPAYYWSSTSSAVGPSFAWEVYFSTGVVSDDTKGKTHLAWAVRSGP